jgi:serralysin
MTATDASNFTSTDRLFFESASVSTLGVVDTPAVSGPLSSSAESITLTSGTHSLTFAATQLSYASTHDGLIFINGDALGVGTGAGDTLTFASDPGVGHHAAVYGFDGNDTIGGTSTANDTLYGGAGNDVISGSSGFTDAAHHFTESDYYMGGAGNDTIAGGAGNDHIYGNLLSSTAGAADGGDKIDALGGNDYVNGNAGDDSINGGDGNDRLYGGGGNDTIGGGLGNDYLQGNKGDDLLQGYIGDDTIHGGAGNDVVRGVQGNDHVYGDNGDDTVIGDSGFDTLSGGAGNDVFIFFTGNASNVNVSDTTSTVAGVVDTITDFTTGEDHISIYDPGSPGAPPGFTVNQVYHQATGVTFTSAAAAQVYAEQLMDNGTHTGEVAAIQVGADTYLFYNDTNHDVTGADPVHSINEAIKLTGVTASTITTDDFI